MAKTPVSGILRGQIRGRIGDLVYRLVDGDTVIGERPGPREGPPTAAQLAQQNEVRRASRWGTHVFADPVQKALYAAFAKARGTKAVFALTMRDALLRPEIQSVNLTGYAGHVGDVIRVDASDDFEVTSLRLVIFEETSGAIVEQGPATRGAIDWEYRAQVEAPRDRNLQVRAIATDRPGNEGMASHVWHA